MRYFPSFQRYNASHEAITIFPDLAGDGLAHVKSNIADRGGELLVANQEIGDLLKVDVVNLDDARFQIRKALRTGKFVLAIDCGKSGDWHWFEFLDKVSAIEETTAYLLVDPVRAEEFSGTNETAEWVKEFAQEAKKMEKALNNRVFFVSGPDPIEEEEEFFYGPYFGLKSAEKAAEELYPDFCYSDKDFEVVYRLKQSA